MIQSETKPRRARPVAGLATAAGMALAFLAGAAPAGSAGPSGDGGPADSTTGVIRAFVTIQPQAFFVERIAGPKVQVEVLVGPGQCAETFEATPKQFARMSGAGLYFAIGMPMETTLIPRLQGNFPGLVVIDTQDGIKRRNLDSDWLPSPEGEAPAADEDHSGADPHTWLDPRLAKIMAENIARGFTRVDPSDSTLFTNNLRSLESDLDALDGEVRRIMAPARGREMLVYHPFFGYFAEAYGLKQTAIEVGGFRPGSKYLVRIIERAQQSGTHVVFVQTGVGLSAVESVAKEIGGHVVVLDPLSRDYIVNLRDMASLIRDGLVGG